MSTVVVDDLRHEMDQNVLVSTPKKYGASGGGSKPGDVKTSFLIRTLPRECNPTPVPNGTLNASVSGLLSPVMNKIGRRLDAELETLQFDDPFDDITEDKLKQVTGSQDLKRVVSLQITIDSTKQSVEMIGDFLPALQQLRLQESNLNSFRDLGTSLSSLRILWAMHCQISDLDGIGALVSLRELYLQHNNVNDISPLTMHEELRVIDLGGNQVADIAQIEQLAFCPQLTSLNLRGNRVETAEKYRQIVANFVPQLTLLDDKALSDSERVKLSEHDIDAAIRKHRNQLQAEIGSNLRSTGPNESTSPHHLSCSSSTTSLNGGSVDSPRNDDAGSRLTHGTDIVFAGNVSSALRRHRYEAETGSIRDRAGSLDGSKSTNNSRFPSSHGLPDRPETPAKRISITDTLDRARELDLHKLRSRDAILDELKMWQLESDGTSQIGVPRDAEKPLSIELSSSKRSRSRRKGSIDSINGSELAADVTRARLARRPNTSAGVLRNGVNVREAFVKTIRDESNCPPRPSSRGSFSRSRGLLSDSSSVNILILDSTDDSKRPCSSTKTSKGSFTAISSSKNALGHNYDWNLEALFPKVDTSTAKLHLPTSLTSKQQLERSLASRRRNHGKTEDEDDSSDSDTDDESRVSSTIATGLSSPTSVPLTSFFNVAESLHAIEKWRDEHDAEEAAVLNVASLQQSYLSLSGIAGPVNTSANFNVVGGENLSTSNQHNFHNLQQQHDQKLALSYGNYESDRQIFQLLRDKHSVLKTRDGFRSFFRGIEQERLEGILRQTFADHDKIQRRLQTMAGFFRHEL